MPIWFLDVVPTVKARRLSFKNSIGGTANYYEPESGTDNQAGGVRKTTVVTDAV